MTNRIVQGLWIGTLTEMERLCIQSFQENGHEFHLYSYKPFDDIPFGTVLKDANEILPESEIKRFKYLAQFSNLFFYTLLLKKGGWVTDMDNVCLKHLDFPEKYVFYRDQSETTITTALAKCPPNSPIMKYCCDRINSMSKESLDKAPYQSLGPDLTKEAVPKFGLIEFAKPGITFDPIHCNRILEIVDPNAKWDLSRSYSLHLFHGAWNDGPESAVLGKSKLNTNTKYPDGCLYEKLKKKPEVTCICPTANRQDLISVAVQSFLSQTHTDSELLIMDDGDRKTRIPDDTRIRYIKLDSKLSIGEKRNFCCESAKGEIIAHFDDDDWSHPDRLKEQVKRLKETGKQVTGYHSLSYYDINERKAFQYLGGKTDGSLRGSYACGASQCYLKSYWQLNRFGDLSLGEDSQFANRAKSLGVLDSTDGLDKLVALRHATNTWAAENKTTDWKSVDLENLPSAFIKEFPKVSIVITTFNRPKQLSETLKSIVRQSYKNFEIVVVDDGDDAETSVICNNHGAKYIHLYRSKSEYRNPSLPINVGIRRARGHVIILQNAECKHIDPNTIEKLSSAVTDKNVVFAKVISLYQNGSIDMVYCGTERTKPYFFCGAIKKSWFEKLRGMDEDYPVGGYDDDDFGDRLRKEGLEFVFTDVEVHHQWHSRLSLSEAAPRAMYLEKTAAMAAGTLGTIRNLNREWGEETEPPYPPPEPPPYICPCSDCVKKRAKK